MKYFLLLASQGEIAWEELTAEEQAAEIAKHEAFDEACSAHPTAEMVGGESLGDGSMATTLRTKNGEMITTDGPYAEAAEQIGGFYILEAPDLDTVIELCKILPPYEIDIRPVLDLG